MYLISLLPLLFSSCRAASTPQWSADSQQHPLLLLAHDESLGSNPFLFHNPPPASGSDGGDGQSPSEHRIPTAYESAVLGRRILALTALGTVTTVYPERGGDHLGGVPVGLMEYLADCEGAGNPTLLAVDIATPYKNYRAGSNISMSLQWTPPFPPARRIGVLERAWWELWGAVDGVLGAGWRPWLSSSGSEEKGEPRLAPRYSAANLPRFSMMGYLEDIDVDGERSSGSIQSCYLRSHPDARLWLPGNRIHSTRWVRLVVTAVYWVGGFGDRAYIGWISDKDWASVTEEEWRAVRLPGEKEGWDEWKGRSEAFQR